MIKTQSQKRIFMFVVAFVVLSGTSFAAEYDWTGYIDVDWDNPGNWDVTGSIYTWPNEQFGDSWVNKDCDEINIATGGVVDRVGDLRISGADDGSNEVVLTIDNSSELNIHPGFGKDIWIAVGDNSRGRVEVRDGSHLELEDGAIRIGEGNTSVGALNIINGTVDIAQWLIVGRTSKGTVEIKNGNLNIEGWGGWSSLYVAYNSNSTGTLDINNGNVNIEDSLIVGNSDNSTGIIEIKNSNFNISKHLSLGNGGEGTSCSMSIKDNSIINIGSNLRVGNSDSSTGTLEIKNSTLDIGSNLQVGNSDSSTGTLEIKDSTLVIGGSANLGGSGNTLGILGIKDSTVEIGEDLFLAKSGTSTGTLEIKGGTLDIGNNLILVRRGASGTLSIKGNSIINIGGEFQMNAQPTGMVSEVVMDDGVVTVLYDSYLNFRGDGDSVADFTLNNGIWDSGGNINVGKTDEGDSCLTINGGMMQAGQKIFVGNPGIDLGESKIFLNGGVLQGEDLEFNLEPGDSLIIYRGGELRIRSSALDETDMQDLIDIGKIDVPTDYEITTIGNYTVLRS